MHSSIPRSIAPGNRCLVINSFCTKEIRPGSQAQFIFVKYKKYWQKQSGPTTQPFVNQAEMFTLNICIYTDFVAVSPPPKTCTIDTITATHHPERPGRRRTYPQNIDGHPRTHPRCPRESCPPNRPHPRCPRESCPPKPAPPPKIICRKVNSAPRPR